MKERGYKINRCSYKRKGVVLNKVEVILNKVGVIING